MNVGFPVELTLDEVTIFDARIRTLSQVTIVYDLQEEIIKHKVRAFLPDGSLKSTEFRIRSNVSDLVGLVTPERPEINLKVQLSEEETVDAHLKLDPNHLDRFYIRVGDSILGSGRKIRSEGADMGLLVALLLGSGVKVDSTPDGGTEVEIDIGGLDDFFDMPDGYDVEIELELSLELDLGFVKIKIELHVGTGGSD